MMDGFYPQFPEVRDMLDGTWVITRGMTYTGRGKFFYIPSGFSTDMGSVPDIVDSIIPACATQADPAYILHDWIYHLHRIKQASVSRKEADQILLDALLILGVSKIRAYTIYYAVRLGGSHAWSS